MSRLAAPPMPSNATPGPNNTCVDCRKNGHYEMPAVEFVDGEPLCVWHRDGDPCPQCALLIAANKAKSPAPTPTKARKTRTLFSNSDRILSSKQPVSFQDIAEEFKGERVFESVKGMEVRYPTVDEVRARVRRGPKGAETDEIIALVDKSPTQCVEFRVPKGISQNTFASRLAGRARKRGDVGKYSVSQDRVNGTVIMWKQSAKAAAGGR